MTLALWLAQQDQLPEAGELVWPLVAAGILAVPGIATWLARAGRRAYRALRDWVRATAAAVETSNGTSLGEMVEHTRDRVDQVAGRLDLVAAVADENRALARTAQALAEHTAGRLDDHLIGHGQTKEGT